MYTGGEEKNEGEGGVSALFVCAECVCVRARAVDLRHTSRREREGVGSSK